MPQKVRFPIQSENYKQWQFIKGDKFYYRWAKKKTKPIKEFKVSWLLFRLRFLWCRIKTRQLSSVKLACYFGAPSGSKVRSTPPLSCPTYTWLPTVGWKIQEKSFLVAMQYFRPLDNRCDSRWAQPFNTNVNLISNGSILLCQHRVACPYVGLTQNELYV